MTEMEACVRVHVAVHEGKLQGDRAVPIPPFLCAMCAAGAGVKVAVKTNANEQYNALKDKLEQIKASVLGHEQWSMETPQPHIPVGDIWVDGDSGIVTAATNQKKPNGDPDYMYVYDAGDGTKCKVEFMVSLSIQAPNARTVAATEAGALSGLWLRRLRPTGATPAALRLTFARTRSNVQQALANAGELPARVRELKSRTPRAVVAWWNQPLPDAGVLVALHYRGDLPLLAKAEAKSRAEWTELTTGRTEEEGAELFEREGLSTIEQHFLDRRKICQAASDPRQKQMLFFCDMDQESDLRVLDERLDAAAALDQAKRDMIKKKRAAIVDLEELLRWRVRQRGAHHYWSFKPAPGPLARQELINHVKGMSAELHGLMLKRFPGAGGGVDLGQLRDAFAAFAAGSLRVWPDAKDRVDGVPNSTNYFSFAELALLAAGHGDPKAFWREAAHVFVATADVYVRAFRTETTLPNSYSGVCTPASVAPVTAAEWNKWAALPLADLTREFGRIVGDGLADYYRMMASAAGSGGGGRSRRAATRVHPPIEFEQPQ